MVIFPVYLINKIYRVIYNAGTNVIVLKR